MLVKEHPPQTTTNAYATANASNNNRCFFTGEVSSDLRLLLLVLLLLLLLMVVVIEIDTKTRVQSVCERERERFSIYLKSARA